MSRYVPVPPPLRLSSLLSLVLCACVAGLFATLIAAPEARAQHPGLVSDAPPDGNGWSDQFGGFYGFNGLIETISVGEAGLFVGGLFSNVRGHSELEAPVHPRSMVASWTGTSWHFFTDVLPGEELYGNVRASVLDDDDLYVAGYMYGDSGSASVARWDGEQWHSVARLGALGFEEAVVFDGDLYVGGRFDSIGGVAAQNLARWDGTRWHSVGEGVEDGVQAMAVGAGGLYVAHTFDGNSSGIVRWSGERWDTTAQGVDGVIHTIMPTGEGLYAGGRFEQVGDVPASCIARWDGVAWHALGRGVSGYVSYRMWPGAVAQVTAIRAFEGDVYVAGNFARAGSVDAHSIARWDGEAWSALPWRGPHTITELAVDESGLYAAVNNYYSERDGRASVVRWDGARWHVLDGPNAGTNGVVRAVAASGATTYVGGSFTTAGDEWVSGIAAWTEEGWQGLGHGVDGIVHAIAVDGNDVYVGGTFTEAGDQHARHVAKWDGRQWESLGSGVDTTVHALAVRDKAVYAGMVYAPGSTGPPVKRWDGAQWEALGSGLTDSERNLPNGVYDLLFKEGDLYAAGDWLQVEGGGIARVARWTGTSWEAVGGVRSPFIPVYALAVLNDELYAGHGVVQKWTGTEWKHFLRPGTGSTTVRALAVHGDTLYVGGYFTYAATGGGHSSLLRVYGGERTGFDGGLVDARYQNYRRDGTVHDLVVREDGALFVGGDFRFAGDEAANNVALWREEAEGGTGIEGVRTSQVHLMAPYPNPSHARTRVRFYLPAPAPVRLDVYDVLGRHVAVLADAVYPDGISEVVWKPNVLPAGSYFVRLQSGGALLTRPFVRVAVP